MTGGAQKQSSERNPRATTTLQVEIFGSSYHVRSGADPAHLEALATLVDGKMREIADRVATVETSRIAILAALNLADDLVRARRQNGSENAPGEDELVQQAAGLLDRLEKVLDE